jgi:ABC-type lipoprotein release transport system permease subunit
MQNRINLLFLLLYSHRKRNLSIFFIATLLVTLLSATLFISSSIKEELLSTLNKQADFTIQKFVAGKVLNTPKSWIDEFLSFEGVSSVQGRVYGMHFYDPKESAFMVVGVDMYEKQIVSNLQKLIEGIDMEKFLSRNSMLIGRGVKKFFDTYAYYDYYIFRPPDRGKVKVYIYDTLPKESALMSNDMILMQESVAREILEVKEAYVTDIILNVANQEEMQKVEEKLIRSHFNIRIIKKSEIAKFYTNLFNYKGGVFLSLFLISLSTFLIILYQRYSVVTKMESKEIALLRMLGWRIKSIIYLKVGENFILATLAYIVGVIAAYIYVFVFDAPLLRDIFLGYSNLESHVSFSFYPDTELLGLLYILFIVPFILTVIIPLYKIAITDISEVIR